MAKPSAGDFTGKQKQKLIKEAQAQQTEAAKATSMATAVEERRKGAEVVDYTAKKQAPKVDTGPKDLTVTPDEDDETIARIVAGTSEPEAGTIDEAEDLVEQVAPVVTEKTKVLIRAKYDMSQVTIGKGTFYNFEEGQRYYVPPNVANHLSERDYVDIL